MRSLVSRLRHEVADGINVLGFARRQGQLQCSGGDVSGHAASIAGRRNALQSRLLPDTIILSLLCQRPACPTGDAPTAKSTALRGASAGWAALMQQLRPFFEQQCHAVGFTNRFVLCTVNVFQTQSWRKRPNPIWPICAVLWIGVNFAFGD